MGIIWDTRMPKRKPGILSTLDLVGLEMEESIFLAGCWRKGNKGREGCEVLFKDVRVCPHRHHLRKRLKSMLNWSSRP